jgi:hypothetical protein
VERFVFVGVPVDVPCAVVVDGAWHLDLEDVTDRQGAFRILVPPRGRYRLGFVRRYVRFEQEVLRGGEEVAPGGPHLELRAVPR